MAFSNFSHLEDQPGALSILKFVVGMSGVGGAAAAEDAVARMLPMSKIVPGKPIERRVRAAPEGGKSEDRIAVEENPDIKFGLKIVLGACRVPITTIASNAGEQGAVIVEKILQQVRGPSSFSPPPASAAVHAARWACRGCLAG